MSSQQNLDRAREIIYNHDLSPTIRRMVLINKWSEKHAKEACKQYRNYLFLKLKYGHEYDLPPSVDIDEVWHNHILDTEDYMKFCIEVFGYFLHHHPTHQKENKMVQQEFEKMFEEQTQKLHFQEFGKYIYMIKPLGIQTKIFNFFESILRFILATKKANLIYRS